jgi:hypothetical protein
MEQFELPFAGANESDRGLAVRGPSDRLSALMAEHDKLRKRIAAKRLDVERIEGDLQSFAAALHERVQPLIDECERLEELVHGLFRELLAPGRLRKQARSDVREIYRLLQEDGVLGPTTSDDEAPPADPYAPRWAPPGSAGQDAPPRPGAATVRETFLRLARSLHPDKVLDDVAKEDRTEAMKAVNEAYEAGDLARLLDIERSWAAMAGVAVASADAAARCRELERLNEALRSQLAALDRELKALRRSPPAQLIADPRRRGRPAGAVEILVEEGGEARAALEKLHAFVTAFRDGRISLAEFLCGPDGPADDDVDPFVALQILLSEEFGAPGSRPRRKRGRKRRRASRG